MGDTGESSDLKEVLAEGPARRFRGQSVAGVLAKSMLSVIESRVASVGHLRPELRHVHRGSSELKSGWCLLNRRSVVNSPAKFMKCGHIGLFHRSESCAAVCRGEEDNHARGITSSYFTSSY